MLLPLLPVIHVTDEKVEIQPMYWELIPHWSRDSQSTHKLWNNTINAGSETMFDKPSYRGSAKYRRSIISVNSFFEHHQLNKQAYLFNIKSRGDEILTMAVLWDEWTDVNSGEIKHTCSVLTVEGNNLLSTIHNNPKLKGPIMSLILENEQFDTWLGLVDEELTNNEIQ